MMAENINNSNNYEKKMWTPIETDRHNVKVYGGSSDPFMRYTNNWTLTQETDCT